MKRESSPPPEPIPAPPGLSPKSAALWAALVPAQATTPARREFLYQALLALDRADAAAATVMKEGMITVTERSGVAHIHPLVKAERESRQAFARMWTALALHWPH